MRHSQAKVGSDPSHGREYQLALPAVRMLEAELAATRKRVEMERQHK